MTWKALSKLRVAIRGDRQPQLPHRKPHLESIYRSLFLKELERHGIDDIYYPVGSAANHSLLYFVARAMREFNFRNVVELGAGQTSILIDSIRKANNSEFRSITVEHDKFWADRIHTQVGHEVFHSELRPLVVKGRTIDYYDIDPEKIGSPVDMLIIDGPPAYTRKLQFSRLGALNLASSVSDDFIILIDDAERVGEAYLVQQMMAQLRGMNRSPKLNYLAAAKVQAVITGGEYSAAAFF